MFFKVDLWLKTVSINASVVFFFGPTTMFAYSASSTPIEIFYLVVCVFLCQDERSRKKNVGPNQHDELLNASSNSEQRKKEFVNTTIIKANIWWFHCTIFCCCCCCYFFLIRLILLRFLVFLYLKNTFGVVAYVLDEKVSTYSLRAENRIRFVYKHFFSRLFRSFRLKTECEVVSTALAHIPSVEYFYAEKRQTKQLNKSIRGFC